MIFGRVLTGAFALATGIAAAQLPEFAQQYRQRLGGAVDELTAVVQRFDADARAESLSRAEALKKHLDNTDDLFKRRGRAMIDTIARQELLQSFQKDLANSTSFGLVADFASRMDGEVARATLKDFQPAVPVTTEGGVLAALGVLFGWLMVKVLALPRRLMRLGARTEPAR